MENRTPLFVFVARPAKKSRLAGLFGDGPLRRLLEDPGALRYAGWDLQTRDQARIIKGEYLEVKLADRKVVRLYEDGMLSARVPADETFLGWAATDDRRPFSEKPRLNPISLLEFSYNFVELYRRVAEHCQPTPETHALLVSIRNTTVNEKKLYMNPYGLGAMARLIDEDRYEAPDDSGDVQVEVDHATLMENSARAAYLLVEKIYLWFGVPTNKIPYTIGDGLSKALDVDLIKTGGKPAQK